MAVALDKAIDTPLLKALQGVTDSVARGMEKKLKSALTPIQLLVATSQYLTFHPKAAKATFDDTGIPQTFQGIVMLVQKPTMVAEAFKESLVHEYHEIQEAAKSGDYRRTGQLVGKAVFESAEFLTSFGKTDTLLTHTPAQLKKLGNVSTATRKEVAVIQEIAEKHGLEIGIRTADPLTAAVRKIATQFHLPNKPSSIKEKTFFGLLYHKETKQWIITDLDVSFIKKNGQLVNNSEGLGYLNEINAKLNAMGLQSRSFTDRIVLPAVSREDLWHSKTIWESDLPDKRRFQRQEDIQVERGASERNLRKSRIWLASRMGKSPPRLERSVLGGSEGVCILDRSIDIN